MKARIYCRTTAKGVQTFYLDVEGMEYYLFHQDFKVSNREYFGKGIRVEEVGDFSKVHSESTKKTLSKIPSYLKWAEKEYGIKVLEKSRTRKRKNNAYKREAFLWRSYINELAYASL